MIRVLQALRDANYSGLTVDPTTWETVRLNPAKTLVRVDKANGDGFSMPISKACSVFNVMAKDDPRYPLLEAALSPVMKGMEWGIRHNR